MKYKRFFQQTIVVAMLLVQFACTKSPGQAVIASADPRATDAGMEILVRGGNAFDAAVAVAAALSVVEPAASGLGGGGFFLLYVAADEEYRFVDARETAPGRASRDMFLDQSGKPVERASTDGALAAAIPGEPAGLVYLADNYGRLALDVSLAPAIRLAEEGFKIKERALLGLIFRKPTLLESLEFARIFYPDGDVPEVGALIRQPELAATLKRFAAQGFDGFYRGETARLLIDGVRQAGGIWTTEDLENYRVIERQPIVINYGGMKVITAPPPSSGGVALTQMFNFLSGYKLQEADQAERSHYFIEAMRRAYRDRAIYMGDPDFVTIPLDMLTSPEYMAGQRVSVRSDRATLSENLTGVSTDDSEGTQTTHFSILDKDGNRVAATITINTWYGSGFIPPGTGVILNNEMDDFSIKSGVPNNFNLIGGFANAIEPGKRPLSSMTPTFLESERGIAILGTPGGSQIITMVLEAALAWHEGATAKEMVSRKRFHHQYLPDIVTYEKGAFAPEVQSRLEAMGHNLVVSRRPYGNMNVVTWEYATNQVEAVTDPRGESEGQVY